MSERKEEVKEPSVPSADECCPVCFLVRSVKERQTRFGPFIEHFFNAQIEMLKAFRSLVDTQIAAIEKRKAPKAEEKTATRIDVE